MQKATYRDCLTLMQRLGFAFDHTNEHGIDTAPALDVTALYVRKCTVAQAKAYDPDLAYDADIGNMLLVSISLTGYWSASLNDHTTDDCGRKASSLLRYLRALPFCQLTH